jgi:hypothetical protein
MKFTIKMHFDKEPTAFVKEADREKEEEEDDELIYKENKASFISFFGNTEIEDDGTPVKK